MTLKLSWFSLLVLLASQVKAEVENFLSLDDAVHYALAESSVFQGFVSDALIAEVDTLADLERYQFVWGPLQLNYNDDDVVTASSTGRIHNHIGGRFDMALDYASDQDDGHWHANYTQPLLQGSGRAIDQLRNDTVSGQLNQQKNHLSEQVTVKFCGSKNCTARSCMIRVSLKLLTDTSSKLKEYGPILNFRLNLVECRHKTYQRKV